MSRYGVMTERWGWQPAARMLNGLPTWAWRCAPAGLLTRRQMRAAGLAPGGAEPVAQVICKRGRRKAYLYDQAELVPKRTPSPAQLDAVAKAIKARRWCPTGQHYAAYCIPTSLGECVDCHYKEPAAQGPAAGTAAAGDEQRPGRLVEHERAGRDADQEGASASPAPRGCGAALDRARAALDRLHDQAGSQRDRWMPTQVNATRTTAHTAARTAAWLAGEGSASAEAPDAMSLAAPALEGSM